MAGGKLSARQKMINLMYLIFIAMLALNMSKEVLQAFGLMNDRLEENNSAASTRNMAFLNNLGEKASEQPEKFQALKAKADQINVLADDLSNYIEDLKKGAISEEERLESGQLNAELMDKGDYFDGLLFIGDKLKPEGQAFIDKIDAFRTGVVGILGDSDQFKDIVDAVNQKFNTDGVKTNDGPTVDYLNYHYFGFPEIASIAKMSGLQNDVKTTQSEVLSAMLQGQLSEEISLKNYQAIVIPDKTAFFSGEKFTGKVVLGRFDNTLNFDKVVVNGSEVNDLKAGQVQLSLPTGNVGTKKIQGELFYTEGGEQKSIPIASEYTVINRPNSATIAADKMNVVYRGVENPMTISFAGVDDNSVSASGNGLRRVKGSSYLMSPGKGKTVTINVVGKLPDGAADARDSKEFRIKDIPRPTGTMRNDDGGALKMTREAVGGAPVGATLVDFDFDLNLRVNSFKFKAPGSATVLVQGNKLNPAAKNALKKAKRGSTVQIFDIKAKIQGNSSYNLRKVSPVIIELTN
ncbi:gliding motility protein GldM [uncultured Dokdonia sp.]|uniref:type IX secretion system motor protein PorM/GldM n=1 Tax=uncultured Dokdonia sp. TaxID=575653 RepID=UPI00261F1C83|nr:gliding motility protein GldM [uncultured Dokdonia sp.]